MLTESARVVSVDKSGLWVETYQRSACEACSAQKGCGQSLLASSVMQNMSLIKARFLQPSQRVWLTGDSVEIGIEENAMVIGTLLTYMLPLLIMLVCCSAAFWLTGSDVYSALAALAGLAIGAGIARRHSSINAGNTFYHAFVVDEPSALKEEPSACKDEPSEVTYKPSTSKHESSVFINDA